MNSARKKLELVLGVVAAASVACSMGCDSRAAKQTPRTQAEVQYYQQQEKILEQQNAEWERQTKRLDVQDKRYDALLAKWEEHAQRVDALLDRFDPILDVLEERLRDR